MSTARMLIYGLTPTTRVREPSRKAVIWVDGLVTWVQHCRRWQARYASSMPEWLTMRWRVATKGGIFVQTSATASCGWNG